MENFDRDGILVGESAAMRELRALIHRVAPKHMPVLIHGPTGAGKELVALALHLRSGRSGSFVPFNVCAVADTMFEDTLFGHARGAFTGAVADSSGYMTEADGGTLFLDEISGLGAAQQIKLLRAVETGSFRPVGGRRDRRSDFRVVAATNEDLPGLVRTGRFRADLLHRLNGITIRVPALQERTDDIPLLVQHFLTMEPLDAPVRVGASAMKLLQEHSWPGNVRELRHAVARMVALAEHTEIGRADVVRALQCADTRLAPTRSLARDRLVEVLDECGWNAMRAAAVLGVHWTTVYRRMRRFGIARPGGGTTDGHRFMAREVAMLKYSAHSHASSVNVC
jgi:two-component system, NtrC family, response regulator HydG